MSEYYDRKGRPMEMLEWTLAFGRKDRQIAHDETPHGAVSTVWLGLNHAYSGPPLIFETMVFGGPLDGEMDRYSTEEQAIAGHAAMLARVLGAA